MEKYRKIRQIGQGAFGSVILVEEKRTGDKYVIKVVNTARMTVVEQQKVLREVSLLADMEHPNIVQYKESFREGGCVHIVMEHCDGGDLFTFIAGQRGRHVQGRNQLQISDIEVTQCAEISRCCKVHVIQEHWPSQNWDPFVYSSGHWTLCCLIFRL